MGDPEQPVSERPCCDGATRVQDAPPERVSQTRTSEGLHLQAAGGLGGEALCEAHREPLKLFCWEDRVAICLVCDKSKKHRTHLVLPIEEAAQDYKEELQIKLQNLKLGRRAVERSKQTREKQMAEYVESIKAERAKIVQAFQQLRLFLEEQESCLLAQLNELEKEKDETSARLSTNVSFLNDLICDLEKHCQRAAGEFLQDLKDTLNRCETGKYLCFPEKPVNLEKNLSAISQQSGVLIENFKKFQESLTDEIQEDQSQRLNAVLMSQTDQPQAFCPVSHDDAPRAVKKASPVRVTLDPRTANPYLFLSLDQKTVMFLDHMQPLLDNPERFDSELFVLACESFCCGKHSWEVNVEQGQNWAIGIAQESVKRKGFLSLSPEQGICAIQQCWGQFQALTSPWTALVLHRKPRRIKVYLDYEGGWVEFFDAELDAPLFTFPPISFKQEKIHPWFWVGSGSQLTLCS